MCPNAWPVLFYSIHKHTLIIIIHMLWEVVGPLNLKCVQIFTGSVNTTTQGKTLTAIKPKSQFTSQLDEAIYGIIFILLLAFPLCYALFFTHSVILQPLICSFFPSHRDFTEEIVQTWHSDQVSHSRCQMLPWWYP